jgi:hypothetical protein
MEKIVPITLASGWIIGVTGYLLQNAPIANLGAFLFGASLIGGLMYAFSKEFAAYF